MVSCGMCGKRLPEDPNELDEIVDCAYCDAVFCSSQCANDHEGQEHAADAVPVADEDERR